MPPKALASAIARSLSPQEKESPNCPAPSPPIKMKSKPPNSLPPSPKPPPNLPPTSAPKPLQPIKPPSLRPQAPAPASPIPPLHPTPPRLLAPLNSLPQPPPPTTPPTPTPQNRFFLPIPFSDASAFFSRTSNPPLRTWNTPHPRISSHRFLQRPSQTLKNRLNLVVHIPPIKNLHM